jgi:hypothetical protein
VADKQPILILGGLGVLGYFAYTQGWLAGFLPGASSPAGIPPGGAVSPVVPPGVTVPPATPPPTLTAADAAAYPYSGSVTPDQMKAIGATLNPQIAAGQIPQIAGGSVLAYMLGWGGASTGASKTTSGETYTFDGANWNLQASAPAPAPPTVTKKALSDALSAWAVANGYPGPRTVSEWNWILNNRVVPGTQAEMSGPANPISAKDYVALLAGDTAYDTSAIVANYGLAGLGDDQVDDGWLTYAWPWAPTRVPFEVIHGGQYLRYWRDA